MSASYTYNATETFNVTHAKHIAAKVAADLMRFNRFYNNPTIEHVNQYEAELTAHLKAGVLDNVTYGFMRDGKWVEALRYHALSDGTLVQDDDPGKIRPGIDVSNATFWSFLVKNSRWNSLTPAERSEFNAASPIARVDANEPTIQNGYWSHGQNYSAGGRGIGRSTIMRY
jgi:hypothetical protein